MTMFSSRPEHGGEITLLSHKMRELVARKMGMVINDDDLPHFMSKVRKRMDLLNLETVPEYHNQLVSQRTSDEEWQQLLELVLIKETTFFRNPMQFQSFKNQIVPELLENKRRGPLRIWVAGSSTGEEAYTLAIILKEAQNEMMTDLKYQILATDLSHASLAFAQEGVYSARSVKGVPQHLQMKYFSPHKQGYLLSDSIKGTVDFRYQNLVEDTWPPYLIGKWDVIFCRNVIIYFRQRTIKTLIDRFYEMLNDNGYFFAGHSENIGVISEKFLPVEMNGVFIYKKLPFKYIAQEAPAARLSHKVIDQAISSMRGSGAPSKDLGTGKVPSARGTQPAAVLGTGAVRKESVLSSEQLAAKEKERRGQGLSLCSKARDLFKTDDCHKALLYLDRVIELDPSIGEAYLIRAQIYTDHGELKKARENCQKAIELSPENAGAYFILGLVELKENLLPAADAALKKCIYIDPDFAPAYFQLSQIAQSLGDNKSALLQIKNAIKAFKTTEHRPELTEYSAGFSREFLIKACESSKVNLERALNG